MFLSKEILKTWHKDFKNLSQIHFATCLARFPLTVSKILLFTSRVWCHIHARVYSTNVVQCDSQGTIKRERILTHSHNETQVQLVKP